ncbi:SgcJ/EcaC family oxidoreductase [Micromonospora sp. NPDC048898]|uniref:SgcJ/EcaC family oxidoreductase n=1 Tax=Micromonospora sp. NPDC048898 TaxID=3364260 RepID=UPI00371261C9
MAEETAAVQRLYEELLTAWNDRDARRYAALFADDASLVGFDGSQVSASELEGHLAPIFTDHPTASYVWRVQEVRPLGDAVALLRARVGMVPPGQTDVNPAVNAVQSLVAVQQNGTWRVALFHNTPAQYHGRSDLADQHTADMRDALAEASSRS